MPTPHDPHGPRADASWIDRWWHTASGAVVAEFRDGIEPCTVFERLARGRHCLFLDSGASRHGAAEAPADGPALGRSSFVAVDPIHSLELLATGTAADVSRVAVAFEQIRTLLTDLGCVSIPGLPPFQGGLAGLFSYECGLVRLGLPSAAAGPDDMPLLSLHVYDVVCSFDNDSGRGWIISQGVPARDPIARRTRARARLDALVAALKDPPDVRTAPRAGPRTTAVPGGRPFASSPLPGADRLLSTQSRESHIAMVRAGIEFVRAGDVFQVNLAQQFTLTTELDPVAVHLRGRQLNPAPFSAFFSAGDQTVVSMSPERLLQVERGMVRMHPIKGTRRMISLPEADLFAGEDLEGSAKDRAENVMIVDLVRNDLSRVCTPDSVRVEALCRLERYRYVQHLVSVVAGRLRPGLSPLDALDAAIPGGSVTGAPKRRACEIIGRLEGFRRNAYCGSLGYVGFDGQADFNLLIRTLTFGPDGVRFAVGGGITAASDPAAEYAETLHKAEGMLRVLTSFAAQTRPTPPGAAP